ncbi:YdcF family protein [Pontibacillus yanchengensis]|uniref:YdcF family protein n=1 Tax=Pontibacillus yanchengensis TaxID=462910 RepID=UPI001F39FCCB|nr:YdcF family protein [Pontibacillus yanchengensis]
MTYPFDCITDFIFVETDISPADVILVPGADHPQLIEKAVTLYKQSLAPYILPSGGYKPQHTLENARFSLEVLKQKDIAFNKVILVCKAGNSRRALLCYQSEFPKEVEFLTGSISD